MTDRKNFVKEHIVNHQILSFFILVFGLSIPLWLLQLLIKNNSLPLNIPITDILAAFTPLLAGIILSYIEYGKAGVKKLITNAFAFYKIDVKKIIQLTLLPILIFLIIYFVITNFYPTFLPQTYSVTIWTLPLLLIFFFLGAIGEEIGYMGYVYPKMDKKFGMIKGAILLGLIWSIWHYPSMWEQGRNLTFFFWGTVGTISYRVIYVLIYKWSGYSVPAVLISHTLYNFIRVIFPNDQTHNPLVTLPNVHYGVILVVLIILLICYKVNDIKAKRY